MRKPKISDCMDEHGTVDFEEYEEAMGDYEDAERERELEEYFERSENDETEEKK